MTGSVINIRATECAPEQEAKYVKWYEDVHVPMLLKIPEVLRVTRYRFVSGEKDHPKYLTIYEFADLAAAERYEKSAEVAASKEEIKVSWPQGGWEHKWKAQYEVTKVWEK